MSQVIQNHVLRVGQTVCVSSQEESKSLQAPGCPSCSPLPMGCGCYCPASWASSAPGVLGQQDISLQRPKSLGQPEEEEQDPSTDPEAQLLSPTLDISIEKLNQLILEIDPSFQPLPGPPGRDVLQPAPQGSPAASRKAMPQATDTQHMEMSPGTATGPELLQASSSPLATSCSSSFQGNSFLPPNGMVLRVNYSPRGSVGFSSSPRATSPQSGSPSPAASPSCSRASGCMAVPLQSRAGQTDSISYGPGAPSTSSGSEKLLKPVHVVRAQHRSSSLLSTSPGSDTSYILGSSHSLLSDDLDAQPAACSPASSLGSPCPPSPSSAHAQAFGLSAQQPRAGCSSRASPAQKGQASSCPPSILSSPADIPVLLVNGCLEAGDAPARLPEAPPASGQQKLPPSCSQPMRLGSLNTAVSAPALSCASDSPLRAGQPTLKFVMDTSKFWFKPSLSRDQAIQLLQAQEPGTFVVRDSTSQRGAFGLALRVPAPPASPTGDESSDLVRHFLIESSAKGVHLRGASQELYFGSLSAFVYQHAITPLALPCKLSIPTRDLAGGEQSPACAPQAALASLKKAAVCNVLYLSSVNVETLTGAPAIQKAISCTFQLESLPTATLVHFRVTEQGVTLTDIQRKVFFRRHYPLAAIRFCGLDPENRKWQKYCKSSRIFGFVAKSQTELENLCHLFAEYDPVQPATAVLQLLCQLLPAP
ncbi:TENS4 protein, partial [Bucco capensis]|nr:TENS4 protein [Bucco capensis]